MNDSSYASSTDLMKTCAAELNRIEESTPNVPEHVRFQSARRKVHMFPRAFSPAPRFDGLKMN
jgi:hypothetical protein